MRILVAYHVASVARRQTQWTDGFAAAIEILSDQNEIDSWNVNVSDQSLIDGHLAYDFVLAKSNWGWVVDRAVRRVFAGTGVRRGIAVSGSTRPPSARRMRFYDVLFYETEWYRPFLDSHPQVHHAFGVNTDLMNPSVQRVDKPYDWMTVGAFRRHKRQWLMLDRHGAKLAVGDVRSADPEILRLLQDGGVEIRNYVSQEALAGLYGQARNVYIPATLHGGGERAVMEAQACGADVSVEADNSKLAELLALAQPWDHHYYAEQLAKGINAAMEAPPRDRKSRTQEWLLNRVPDRRTAATSFRRLQGRIRRLHRRDAGQSTAPGTSQERHGDGR